MRVGSLIIAAAILIPVTALLWDPIWELTPLLPILWAVSLALIVPTALIGRWHE